MSTLVKRRKGYRQSIGSRAFDVINIIIMLGIVVVVLYPILQIIAISFSSEQYIAKSEISIFPKGFHLNNYMYVLRDIFVYYGYRNSIFYAAGSTLIMLVVTSLLAYPLTIDEFPIKKFVTVALTITMFFSGGLIPTYLLMKQLKLIDTVWIMIVPGCVSAMNVFMFRTFFKNIPAELRESAYLDGANDVTILVRIVLPLSKALLATFSLFNIVGVWNSWFNGLIYLKTQELYPLQLILRNYLFVLDAKAIMQRAGMAGAGSGDMMRNMAVDPKGVQMAIIVIAMFPIMAVYPFFQKYFVKGIMIGAIKG